MGALDHFYWILLFLCVRVSVSVLCLYFCRIYRTQFSFNYHLLEHHFPHDCWNCSLKHIRDFSLLSAAVVQTVQMNAMLQENVEHLYCCWVTVENFTWFSANSNTKELRCLAAFNSQINNRPIDQQTNKQTHNWLLLRFLFDKISIAFIKQKLHAATIAINRKPLPLGAFNWISFSVPVWRRSIFAF